MRVVFDTNIFVSALVLPGGQAEKALSKILEGRDTLLISRQILDELLSTLAKKFSHDGEALSRVAVSLMGMSEVIRTGRRLKIFKDDPDNRIIECAIAGAADLVVTGDKTVLGLRRHGGIRIISLREYIEKG